MPALSCPQWRAATAAAGAASLLAGVHRAQACEERRQEWQGKVPPVREVPDVRIPSLSGCVALMAPCRIRWYACDAYQQLRPSEGAKIWACTYLAGRTCEVERVWLAAGLLCRLLRSQLC